MSINAWSMFVYYLWRMHGWPFYNSKTTSYLHHSSFILWSLVLQLLKAFPVKLVFFCYITSMNIIYQHWVFASKCCWMTCIVYYYVKMYFITLLIFSASDTNGLLTYYSKLFLILAIYVQVQAHHPHLTELYHSDQYTCFPICEYELLFLHIQ